jgi:urease accessory protein
MAFLRVLGDFAFALLFPAGAFAQSRSASDASLGRDPACDQATKVALVAVLAVLVPRMAHAHVENGAAAGLISGFAHPLSGWDHMLAMVAVGVWGAQLGTPAMWLLPVAFPMMMAGGAFAGLIGIPLPVAEVAIATSALLLGLMVMLECRYPVAGAMALVGAFGLFHGHAHGAELAPGTSALTYSAGFILATGCLHALGIVLGFAHAAPAGRALLRAGGSVVAVAGLGFLWRAMR